MTATNPQVPWTDEQWARVNQVIHEEASRARVAATFLPLYGPLPPDTDFVRAEKMYDTERPITIGDREIIQLATLQVQVRLRGAQLADPEMRSVLALFRRAANVLGRLEDAIIFDGQLAIDRGPLYGAPPQVWDVHGGQRSSGLLLGAGDHVVVPIIENHDDMEKHDDMRVAYYDMVSAVSDAIGKLESKGYFGPFAVVLDQQFFRAAQTPSDALVLPQDRIIPFLGGGPLLRSSTLPDYSGVVVALGGSPVELVVARDVSLQFLQVTLDPAFYFRVYEKMALRIKAQQAIVRLVLSGPRVLGVSPDKGSVKGGTAVEIWGTNFTDKTAIHFADKAGTKQPDVEASETKMTVSTPGHEAPGKVSVNAVDPKMPPHKQPKDGPAIESVQFEYTADAH